MTTVTEAAKRVASGSDPEELAGRDLGEICADANLARRLSRMLADAARDAAPGREWSIEDLREVLEVAVHGPKLDRVQTLEGRYFRKRLREQFANAERYAEPFSCVVVSLVPVHSRETYTAVMDGVVESLRRVDMVFLYKRRLALILPRMRKDALDAFVARLRNVVAVGTDSANIESIECLACPDPAYPEMSNVLDWAEDRLREI
ncbi:MAG: hypothetical protein IPK60_04165 [Sandaracinaceae bacterium]|nr:hypothetical protein [Sandaracinaceae bacterium]